MSGLFEPNWKDICQKQMADIKIKDEKIKELEKELWNERNSGSRKYCYTQRTVEHFSEKNGQMNKELFRAKTLLFEIWECLTDSSKKSMLQLRIYKKQIEDFFPQVKTLNPKEYHDSKSNPPIEKEE